MKNIFIFLVFFIVSLMFKDDIKVKRKTTYHRHYGHGDELGLAEIIEFDSLGRLVLENTYHPYQNNDLLTSKSIIYNQDGRTFIYCDRNSEGIIKCDTSYTNTHYDTTVTHENFANYKIKTTNKLNYSDTIFFYKNGQRKYQVTYFKNNDQLKVVKKCYQKKEGCLHSILGEDYDSLYKYYNQGQILKEKVFLRDTENEEKNPTILYTYNKENLLIRIDICDSDMQKCEWKIKIVYEYYE